MLQTQEICFPLELLDTNAYFFTYRGSYMFNRAYKLKWKKEMCSVTNLYHYGAILHSVLGKSSPSLLESVISSLQSQIKLEKYTAGHTLRD